MRHGEERARAKHYLKCVQQRLIRTPKPETLQRHGIVAKGDSYEFAEGPEQETKQEKTKQENEQETTQAQPGMSVIRTTEGPIVVENSTAGIMRFLKEACAEEIRRKHRAAEQL